MDGYDEGSPTGLGAWLPAPRRPHPSEVVPPRVVPPRRGGAAYRPAVQRPHIGLSAPPPLVRLPRLTRAVPLRAAMLAGLLLLAAVPMGVALAPGTSWYARLGVVAVLLAAFAVAAERVSFRRRDTALLLVPVLNAFLLLQVLWRLTALPLRPWPPRPDELAAPLGQTSYVDGPDPWDRA